VHLALLGKNRSLRRRTLWHLEEFQRYLAPGVQFLPFLQVACSFVMVHNFCKWSANDEILFRVASYPEDPCVVRSNYKIHHHFFSSQPIAVTRFIKVYHRVRQIFRKIFQWNLHLEFLWDQCYYGARSTERDQMWPYISVLKLITRMEWLSRNGLRCQRDISPRALDTSNSLDALMPYLPCFL